MHYFMSRHSALAVLAALCSVACLGQQPPEDVTDAPARLTSVARIASPWEPGVPIEITGTVLAPDGKTPAGGVVVYAYHTDANGYYRATGTSGDAGESRPRLRGWAKTDESGHFSFLTIKPAPYPHRNVPAHVHVHVWGSSYPRQWFELEFEGDPLIPFQHFTDNTADFLYVMPSTTTANGTKRFTTSIRLRAKSNFPTP